MYTKETAQNGHWWTKSKRLKKIYKMNTEEIFGITTIWMHQCFTVIHLTNVLAWKISVWSWWELDLLRRKCIERALIPQFATINTILYIIDHRKGNINTMWQTNQTSQCGHITIISGKPAHPTKVKLAHIYSMCMYVSVCLCVCVCRYSRTMKKRGIKKQHK